jgi:hypothetical protein
MQQINIQEKIPIYSLFLIILVLCGNYLGELLPCRFQKHLKKSMTLKYIFLFFSLFFLVLYSSQENILKIFYQSIIIFLWFLILMRNTFKFFLFNCLFLFAIYIVYLKHRETGDKKLNLTINILICICSISILVGFFFYYLQKKQKFKTKFNFKKFMMGKQVCSYEHKNIR